MNLSNGKFQNQFWDRSVQSREDSIKETGKPPANLMPQMQRNSNIKDINEKAYKATSGKR